MKGSLVMTVASPRDGAAQRASDEADGRPPIESDYATSAGASTVLLRRDGPAELRPGALRQLTTSDLQQIG